MKSLSVHSRDVARIIASPEFLDHISPRESKWFHACDWLLVAAGIGAVEFDRARLDPAFGWCEGADRYELERDEWDRSAILALTRFSYVWGALESVIEIIQPPGKDGKIRAACRFIHTHYPPRADLAGYSETVAVLRGSYGDAALTKAEQELGVFGSGLSIVYKKRNAFAHGALAFSLPQEESEENPEAHLINACTRVVLLSIQMLLSCVLAGQSFEMEGFEYEEYYENPEVHEVLASVHLEGEEPMES